MEKRIRKHFSRELENIKKLILSLGAIVEERVRMATKAIEDNDAELAQQIIKSDYEIDEMEVDIEEECLKVLALHQPVAIDLRFIIAVIKINNELERIGDQAVIKINNELERIGDQAVNIAERVGVTAKSEQLEMFFDYSAMGEKAQRMLKMSLDALVKMDYDEAFNVVMMDDEVDALKEQAYEREHPDKIGYLINLFLISRHLERLADHTTNIAEEVIYLIEGEIVRHAQYDRE